MLKSERFCASQAIECELAVNLGCDRGFAPVAVRNPSGFCGIGLLGANLSATGATGRFAPPTGPKLGILRL